MKIMGILNVTPDSFSDGGKYASVEGAIRQAERLVQEGADVIDVGGESTRPGYERIPDEEEIRRVVPVIRGIRERLDVTISIDTYKYEVAREAIAAGADMLNSIWGFLQDERLAELVSATDSSVILMHNREKPYSPDEKKGEKKTEKTGIERLAERLNSGKKEPPKEWEADFIKVVKEEIRKSLSIAEEYEIEKDKIWIDPGVGFGKTYEQNLAVIRHVDELVGMGYPVLMAASRKSVIGQTLDLPVDEREEGTIAISVYAAMKGCQMVRVHDVEKNARALRMWEAMR